MVMFDLLVLIITICIYFIIKSNYCPYIVKNILYIFSLILFIVWFISGTKEEIIFRLIILIYVVVQLSKFGFFNYKRRK